MYDDIKTYIENKIDIKKYQGKKEELIEYLNKKLLNENSITGKKSNSYFLNTWAADEAIAHNWNLLDEALKKNFHYNEIKVIEKGTEWADVTIRCYLLPSIIDIVVDNINDIYKLY